MKNNVRTITTCLFYILLIGMLANQQVIAGAIIALLTLGYIVTEFHARKVQLVYLRRFLVALFLGLYFYGASSIGASIINDTSGILSNFSVDTAPMRSPLSCIFWRI